MNKYLNYFGQQSVYNKMYGRLTCHAIIGGITRGYTIKIGKYYDDNRINVFYVAPSGSGKTTGSNVYIAIIQALGLMVHELDDFTDASIAGTVQYADVEVEDEETGTIRTQRIAEETEGILELNDFIHSDEASLLLMPNNYSMKTVIFLQKAMNPIGSAGNKINRTLASGTTEGESECTFVFTTFPPREGSKEVSIMVENGLLQRMAFYPRFMDLNMNKRMTDNMIDGLFGDDDQSVDTEDPEFIELLHEFEKLREAYGSSGRIPLNAKFKVFMKKKARELYKHLVTQDVRPEVKEIMYTYINRYTVMLVKFATHNAMINYRKKIIKEDLEYGWELVFEMFKMSAFWINNNLPKNHKKNMEDADENSPHSMMYKAYARCLKKNEKEKIKYPKVPKKYVSRGHLIAMVKQKFQRKRAWFDENVGTLVDENKAIKFTYKNKAYFKVDALELMTVKKGEEVDLMLELDLHSEFHD